MTGAKQFPRACVASPHYLASSSGLATLASGGNALDAAIATNLVLGVVAPYMCGYGGDIFAIVWDGAFHAYNGSGRYPAAGTRDAVRRACGSDEMPSIGPLSVTVPGAVEGWFTLLEEFGTRSFGDLASTALGYARDGFPVSTTVSGYLRGSAALYADSWGGAWRDVYDGIEARTLLRQPALALTIAALCEDGPDAYYRGPIADAIASTLESHGALMATGDLADHTGDWVQPMSTDYRGVQVLELPPNSVGLAALEALNIVEELPLGETESADRHHVLLEAMKLALADRDAYVTDPEHMTIDPALLASKSWADERRKQIDPERASQPAAGRAAVGGTIYLCAADENGMLVSLIQSNYAGFGSGVHVPDWGINLQNRGGYFSLDPAHCNVVAPRKRTAHTLMPAMAFRGGKPWLVFGTMGGDGQSQTHLQFLTRVIDDGSDIQDAIDAPRWAISPKDWSVMAETRFEPDMVRELERRGHRLLGVGPYNTGMGHAHAIEVTPAGYAAATDPRAEGAALGL